MPNNAHDTSSRNIFSSADSSFSIPPETPEGRGSAASARNAGLFVASEPSSVPASAGRRGQSALEGALAAVPRPASRGWQDKAALTRGSAGSGEPGPDTTGVWAGLVDTKTTRSPHARRVRQKKVKGGVWMEPALKDALYRIARAGGLSFSAAAAKGLEIFARAAIHEQEEELFEPRMRTMLRREIRASDDRRVPFEIRTALAAEHTRLIEADLYVRSLRREGVPLPEIKEKLKSMYRQARANVLKKTPQLQTILDKWWQESPDGAAEHSHEGGGEEGTP